MPPKRARLQITLGERTTELESSKKNTRRTIQLASKRPRSKSLFPEEEGEDDGSNSPTANRRKLEAASALKKYSKGTVPKASNAKKHSSERDSVFAGCIQAASVVASRRQGQSFQRTGVRAETSVFERGIGPRKLDDDDDGSETSDVLSSGRGGRGKESVSHANESNARRVSPRIRDKNNLMFNSASQLASPITKRKSPRKARVNAELLKNYAVAQDFTEAGDCNRSPTRDDEIKSQSQSGSQQLQLTVKAIAKPKLRSKDTLNKKQQAYERVKRERLSEVEMAFIREEFCVHYPPPPSNMAAAGRYELANRREMTKKERDALWENELKPWSDKWWVLYGNFTDLVRAEKMKKPVTSSTDVRRGECKKWAKAFRKEHGDARPQSSGIKHASSETLLISEWIVGVSENWDSGSVCSPGRKDRIPQGKECLNAEGTMRDKSGRPYADSDSGAAVASQGAKSDSDFHIDNESGNGLDSDSRSDRGLVDSLRDRNHEFAADGDRKTGTDPILAPAIAMRAPSGSTLGPCEAESRCAPSCIFPGRLQSRVPADFSPHHDQESTNEDEQASQPPSQERQKIEAFSESAIDAGKRDEVNDFTGPLAGAKTEPTSDIPKVGARGIGPERIPRKKQIAPQFPDSNVGQYHDCRAQHNDSRASRPLPSTGAVDGSRNLPREAPKLSSAPLDVPHHSMTGDPGGADGSSQRKQPVMAPVVKPAAMQSVEYVSESRLMSADHPANHTDNVANGPRADVKLRGVGAKQNGDLNHDVQP